MGAFEIPKRLVESVRGRRCIPFVGAGLSKQSAPERFPTWTELLNGMMAEAARQGHIAATAVAELGDLLTRHKHLMVAEHLKTRVPVDFYYSYLQERFRCQDVSPAQVHRLLVEMNPRLIVTTNYDRLIEDAYAETKSRAMTVLSYGESPVVQRRIQEDGAVGAPFLFKIHGDIDDPAGVILAESDYRKLLFGELGYRTLLASLFIHYTVLFVGFSFSDEELMLTLAELRWYLKSASQPDYILLADNSCTSVERSRFRDDYGLEVLCYPNDGSHSGVKEFLKQLLDESRVEG